MKIFNKSLAIVVLICATQAFQLNFHNVASESTMTSGERKHHSPSNIKPHTIKDFTEDLDKIADNQFHVNVTVNDKPFKMIVDTTSFHSYLQSSDPAAAAVACATCPTGTIPYTCTEGCTNQGFSTVYSSFPFGGRMKDTYKIGELNKFGFDNKNWVSKFFLGLSYTFEPRATQLGPSIGNLGLAYGQLHKKYMVERYFQVNPVARNNELEGNNSLIYTLHDQRKKYFPQPEFSLKIEKDLNVLTVGESQPYFGMGKLQNYTNQGDKNWGLKMTQFKWALTEQVIGEPDIPVTGVAYDNVYALWDSTTKFIWMKKEYTTAFITSLLTKKSITCTIGRLAKEVIECPCQKAKDIGDIKIKLNNQKEVHIIKNEDFVTFDKSNNLCILAVRVFPDAFVKADVMPVAAPVYSDIIILGQPAFKSLYTRFNQETQSISIQEARQVNPENLRMNDTARIWFIILGSVLFLISLIAIVGVFRSINPDLIVPVPLKPVYAPQQLVAAPQYYVPQQSRIASPQQVQSLQQAQSQYRR